MRLSRESRYAIILLVVSAAILAGGTAIRKYAATPKLPPPRPPDLERLQRLTAERRLHDLSDFLADAAATAATRLSLDGLIWDSATVVAPPFQIRPGDHPGAVAPAYVRLSPGDWLLAVARDSSGQLVYAHGIYQAQTRQTCGALSYTAIHSDAALTPALIGGGLFTIEGALVGFIGDCDGRPIPIAASTIADRIAHPPSEVELTEQRLGVRLSPDQGGLVLSVWADSPAAAAGIQPGDLVDPDELPAPEFAVSRRGRSIRLSWPKPAVIRGLSLDASAPVVRAVEPGSSAARAGIETGDRLLRVGSESVAEASSAARAFGRAKGPVTVTVERQGRRLETLLQP